MLAPRLGPLPLALPLAVLLAAGCAPRDAAPPGGGAPARPAGSLERVEWQLVEVEQDGAVRDVRAQDARLRLDGAGSATWSACNSSGGPARVTGQRLQVEPGGSTLIGCTGLGAELDDLLASTLTAGTTWALAEPGLLLSSGGTTLRFAERASPWDRPDATALLEGTRGEAVYRLSWSRSADGLVGVALEVRRAPGQPTGSAGFGLAVDDAVMPWFPVAAAVGDDAALLAVPLRPEVARAVAQHPAGDVELTAFDVPAPGWRVWGALLEHPARGTVVVGYDAAGRELGRSSPSRW